MSSFEVYGVIVRRAIREMRWQHLQMLRFITSRNKQAAADEKYREYEVVFFEMLCEERRIYDDSRLDLAEELGIGKLDWLLKN